MVEEYVNFTRPSTRDQFEDLKVPKLGLSREMQDGHPEERTELDLVNL
jgi:hypothetical protein